MHHRHPLPEAERLALGVGDQHHRQPQMVDDFGDVLPQPATHVDVQVARRLVQEEDRRLEHEGACERYALQLAARESPHVGIAKVRDAEEVEHGIDPDPPLGPAHAAHAQPVLDVAEHPAVEQHRTLEHDCDTASCRQIPGRDRPTEVRQPAGVGCLQQRENAQERALPGTVGAQDRKDLPLEHAQLLDVDDRPVAVRLAHPRHLDGDVGGCRTTTVSTGSAGRTVCG